MPNYEGCELFLRKPVTTESLKFNMEAAEQTEETVIIVVQVRLTEFLRAQPEYSPLKKGD